MAMDTTINVGKHLSSASYTVLLSLRGQRKKRLIVYWPLAATAKTTSKLCIEALPTSTLTVTKAGHLNYIGNQMNRLKVTACEIARVSRLLEIAKRGIFEMACLGSSY